MKHKNRILWVLGNLDVIVAVAMLVVMIAITFLGVFFRYVVGQPFTWLEEMQLICMVWIGFASAGAAFRTGGHIAIEIVVDSMPAGLRRVTEWFIRAVVVAMLLFLTKQCAGYFWLFVQNGRVTPVLRIPYAVEYAIAPISCVLMLASYGYAQARELLARRRGAGPKEDEP